MNKVEETASTKPMQKSYVDTL